LTLSKIFFCSLQHGEHRVATQRFCLPGDPDWWHIAEHRIRFFLTAKRTKHTSTGTSHPGVTVSTEPFYRFCYRREQLDCHLLQVVSSKTL